MNTPSPAMRRLAEQLLEASRSPPEPGVVPRMHDADAVCEVLRNAVTRFAGPDGYAALLRRALALARVEVPALHTVQIGPDGKLEGLEALATHQDASAAAGALATHLLMLLVTFIGESLTLRLVREGWPHTNFDTKAEDKGDFT